MFILNAKQFTIILPLLARVQLRFHPSVKLIRQNAGLQDTFEYRM